MRGTRAPRNHNASKRAAQHPVSRPAGGRPGSRLRTTASGRTTPRLASRSRWNECPTLASSGRSAAGGQGAAGGGHQQACLNSRRACMQAGRQTGGGRAGRLRASARWLDCVAGLQAAAGAPVSDRKRKSLELWVMSSSREGPLRGGARGTRTCHQLSTVQRRQQDGSSRPAQAGLRRRRLGRCHAGRGLPSARLTCTSGRTAPPGQQCPPARSPAAAG